MQRFFFSRPLFCIPNVFFVSLQYHFMRKTNSSNCKTAEYTHQHHPFNPTPPVNK